MNLERFIKQHRLPAGYADSVQRCYLPFCSWLENALAARHGETYVLGINGAQGTGKSTLAQLIGEYFASTGENQVAILSIDDLYLTRDERDELAQQVHPLLRTRGVPGTHDVSLGISVIEQLKSLGKDEVVSIPRFDKSRDDRCAATDWSRVIGPVDLIVLEGWCVGSQAESDADLQAPVNELESTEDADGRWRRSVNDQLRGDYARLFSTLNGLLYLQAPDFGAILNWRTEQEQKLRQNAGKDANAIMTDAQVAAFIQYYERITRNNFKELPGLADATIKLDDDHQAVSLEFLTSTR